MPTTMLAVKEERFEDAIGLTPVAFSSLSAIAEDAIYE